MMKSFIQQYDKTNTQLTRLSFLPPLLSRVTLATAFIVSAKRKFSDLKGNAEYFHNLGIPYANAMVRFVAGTEISCGVLIGLGFGTRLAALPLIPIMATAILTARRKEIHSFVDLTGNYEFTYALLLGYLASYGPGPVSLDSMLDYLRRRSSQMRIQTDRRKGIFHESHSSTFF
ncbi:MAG: DoxX family protein [Bdellovibrionia bacterium]